MLLYLKSASKLCTVQRVYLIVMICYSSRVFHFYRKFAQKRFTRAQLTTDCILSAPFLRFFLKLLLFLRISSRMLYLYRAVNVSEFSS